MYDSDSSRERDAAGSLHTETPARPKVGDYVLAMGHELRTPLNAVIGMSGLLLGGDLGDRQRQYARSIHSAGESLSTILNDLIDLSRIMAGRLPIEPIPFDLRSMVEETVKALGPRAAERDLALRVDWRPELPRQVVGDPGRTRQVLGNLIGRALNATSQGEIAILVAPDGETEGRAFVRFAVEDTGIGLPQSRLAHIFDEYTPIDASPYRSFGTTGLGLRVSAELVRLMGGEIGAESEVGKGSRFWFRLPLPAAESAADLVLEASPSRPGGRALIVEIDQASRKRFAEQLASAGWEADFTDDIGEIETLLRNAADAGSPYRTCILSDYAVRPFHAELALRLKTDGVLASVALVMATAVGSPGEGRRLWHAGFTAYLRKPIPIEELTGTLLALDHVGPDGRNSALITRHSLAEARQAQSATAFDGLDEVLASLTAPVTRQVLVLGAAGTDQIEITEVLARCDLTVEMPAEPARGVSRLAERAYEMVIVDADHEAHRAPAALARLAARVAQLTPRPPLIAITVDPVVQAELLSAGVDHVLVKPIRRTDLEQIARGVTTPQEKPAVEVAADESEAGPAAELAMDAPDAAVDLGEDTAVDLAEDAAVDLDEGTGPDADAAAPDEAPQAAAVMDETPTIALAEPVRGTPNGTPPVVEVVPVDTAPVGAALLPPADGDAGPDEHSASAGDDGPAVEVTPVDGMVRLDPDQEIDSDPVAGFVANELDVDADESAVVEPVELALNGLAPDASIADPGIQGRDADPAGDEPALAAEDGEPAGLSLSEPVAAREAPTGTDEDPVLTDDSESDEDDEPARDDAPVIGLDFGPAAPAEDEVESRADDEADDETNAVEEYEEARLEPQIAEPEATDDDAPGLGVEEPAREAIDMEHAPVRRDPEPVSFSTDEVSIDGEADPEEIAFLAPIASDGVIDSSRPDGQDEPGGEADSELAAIGVNSDAPAANRAEDPSLPVIGTTVLEQLGSQSGGFAQHLVATFLKDAPQRIAELATAVSRGSAEQLAVALRSLKATAGLLGAGRLGAICDDMEASLDREDLEAVAHRVGQLEHAFLQVRMAVEAAAPPEAQAPVELPAIGATFVEQVGPGSDPASRALAMKLLETFQSEAPVRLAELTEAILREDAAAVQRLAPALKGMCGLIGADPLAKLCALVEADARLRRIGSARRYVDQLQLELTRVLEALARAAG